MTTASEQRRCCECGHVGVRHITTRYFKKADQMTEKTRLDCKKDRALNDVLHGCHFAFQPGLIIPRHLQLSAETFPVAPDDCQQLARCSGTGPFNCDHFEPARPPANDVSGYKAPT